MPFSPEARRRMGGRTQVILEPRVREVQPRWSLSICLATRFDGLYRGWERRAGGQLTSSNHTLLSTGLEKSMKGFLTAAASDNGATVQRCRLPQSSNIQRPCPFRGGTASCRRHG